MEKSNVQTNYDKLSSMTIDEMAEWLDKNGIFDGSPWMEWFDENYCSKCEAETITYTFNEKERFGEECYCNVKGKCRFFPGSSEPLSSLEIIKLWLAQKAG